MAMLIAVRDLVFRSKIDSAAERLGVAVATVPRGQPLADAVRALAPRGVIVDLGEAGVMDALRSVRTIAPDVRVIGFFGHLREDLAEAARALGVEVYTRGELAARLDTILPKGGAVPPRSPA
jgi:DNA-binding NarL/FixJ family response regulator